MNSSHLKAGSLVVRLIKPNVDRDAPFALGWFKSDHGNQTLLLMGNAENEIKPSTLYNEKKTLKKFIELEKSNEQITWMIQTDNKTIGAVWIELKDDEFVKSPAVHMMIGDPKYRGKGIGKIIMSEMLKYIKEKLKSNIVYSRHLVNNKPVTALLDYFGFTNDGKSYIDINNLEWQNVKLRSSCLITLCKNGY